MYVGSGIAFNCGEEPLVKLFLRRFAAPATESQLALTLAVSLILMAVMLIGLIWQGNVIKFQQDVIRDLWRSAYNG
jgi:hypothetical protein